MSSSLGRAAFAAILVIAAARADAQITTVIDAPKRPDAKQQAAARREAVAQDSLARVTMTGMKQWVDSAAAALAIRPDTGKAPASDTAAISARPAPTRADSAPPVANRPATVPEFRDRARAPATATPIPSIALIGGVMVLIGMLLRRRPNAVKAKVGRR